MLPAALWLTDHESVDAGLARLNHSDQFRGDCDDGFFNDTERRHDRLRATADNQTINALGGSDWITSRFNASTLYGGNGHDRITVTLDLPEPTEGGFSSTLYGGNGDDWLVSNFTGTQGDRATLEFSSRQSGGDGNDNIFISASPTYKFYYGNRIFDFEVDGGAGADNIWIEVSGADAVNINLVNAGTGADVIYISFEASSDFGRVSNEVYAGAGDDDVIVSGNAGWEDGSEDIPTTIWGEDGNDRLEAMTGASAGFNRLFGGSGDDTLIAIGDVNANSTKLRNSAWGGDGNDTIELNGTTRALYSFITHTAYGIAATTPSLQLPTAVLATAKPDMPLPALMAEPATMF